MRKYSSADAPKDHGDMAACGRILRRKETFRLMIDLRSALFRESLIVDLMQTPGHSYRAYNQGQQEPRQPGAYIFSLNRPENRACYQGGNDRAAYACHKDRPEEERYRKKGEAL